MIGYVEDIRGPKPEDRKRYPIAYAVIKGELQEGTRQFTIRDLHEADLVIIVREGSFWTWKDRYANRGPVTFNEAWVRIRETITQYARDQKQWKDDSARRRIERKLQERV